MNCPKCNEECYREQADVGVGIIYGPYGCPECGWSEWTQYDRSEGESEKGKEHPDWFVDQWGGMIRKEAVKEGLSRFGLDPGIVDTL